MRSERSIVVPFLGQRQYVQGSTLFNVALPFLSDARTVCFKIGRVIRSNHLKVIYLDQWTAEPCAAECSWNGDYGNHIILFEESGQITAVSQAHDEGMILKKSSIDRTATIDLQPPYTFVETVVALNKRYLEKRCPLEIADQYWFTRLDMTGPPPLWGTIELDYERAIGTVHHVTRIALNGSCIGSIYFAKGRRDGVVS